ncbi:MAG: carbohydrate ABC transporter substrate-binding protein, partial [Cutibacterium acnes]|nr:carbohydrate ABC transporter substrate-binding protein [Cutibacterium acnes]
KTFIAWLYSDKATGLFAKAGAAMPTKTGTKGLPAEVAPFYTVYDEPGLKSTIGGFKSAKAVPGIDMKTALLDSVDSVASGKLSVKDWQAKVNEASNKLGGY